MLDYILEITEKLVLATPILSQRDKNNIYQEVSFAIKQTRSHISSTRIHSIDRASPSLSNTWQRTASRLTKIKNPEVHSLAQIIEEKSKYWSDPSNYNPEQISIYRMRLNQVEGILNDLCK